MQKNKLLLALLLVAGPGLGAQTLPSLPVQDYDYHITENIVSPIALGLGGLNLTFGGDYFTSYDNPALLAENTATAFATSFRLKSEETLGFAELVSASNLLKDKQFMYFNLITKSAAWSYQPVASVHVSQQAANYSSSEYYDYQLDKLQLSLAGTDDRFPKLAGGLSLKYLTGRLVYLKESGPDMERVAFIDNKVKGVSGDLGLTWTEENVKWGACVYDVLSYLRWEDYGSESLQRRAALGFQWSTDNLALLAGVQGKVSGKPGSTYHFGLARLWTWNSTAGSGNPVQQNLIIRAGLFSDKFDGTDNISYTLGSGYNYNLFRFDFGLTNAGMRLRDSRYLFSVGIGIQ